MILMLPNVCLMFPLLSIARVGLKKPGFPPTFLKIMMGKQINSEGLEAANYVEIL